MSLKRNVALSLATLSFVACFSEVTLAQTASTKPQPAPTTTAAATAPAATPAAPATALAAAPEAVPAPSPAAPAAAPAPSPVVAVPPGYALIPIDSAGVQTRYEVEYPQYQGALPPGMELPYDEGDPVPKGYRVVKQSRRGLVIAGSIVGGIGYGFAILGATSADFENKSGALMAPVVGPWLMLALGGAKDKPCTADNYSDCGDNSSVRTMLVLDGMMQVAGAAMLVSGIAFPKTRLVRKDVTVSMMPMPLGNHGYGLGAVGQF